MSTEERELITRAAVAILPQIVGTVPGKTPEYYAARAVVYAKALAAEIANL